MVDSGSLGRGIVSVCIRYVGEKVYFADVTLIQVVVQDVTSFFVGSGLFRSLNIYIFEGEKLYIVQMGGKFGREIATGVQIYPANLEVNVKG